MFVNSRFYISLRLSILSTLLLAGSVLAQVSSPSPDPSSYGMTSGRLVATLAAGLGLIGVVIGGLAVARPSGWFGSIGRIGAIVTGLVAAAVGGFRVITASGIGTGGGRAGAIIALVLGVIALALGALAHARSRGSE